MINEINHLGIVTRDLEKSLRFYQDVLGAEVVFKNVIASTQTDVIYLQISGGLIELLFPANPTEEEVFGATHIAFISDDLDNDYKKLTDAGHESLVAPRVAGSGVGRLAFIRDPNGARVELIQRDDLRVALIEHSIVKAFDHYSLIANDEEAALKFYKDGLGLSTLTTLTVPATQLNMSYLHYGYDVLELLHWPTPSTDPIFAHIALRVDDVDEALAAFAAQGVEAEPGTPRVAGSGLGKVGIIRDPDGVLIELLDRPDLREI
jgi:catechol 2,3-dioxygenase-like lactoylglutathione lyase family enzyme